MKNRSIRPLTPFQPNEEDIRNYAYHLYEQSNGMSGHDLDHWLEATACLKASIPSGQSGTRLYQYANGSENDGPSLLLTEARILAS